MKSVAIKPYSTLKIDKSTVKDNFTSDKTG